MANLPTNPDDALEFIERGGQHFEPPHCPQCRSDHTAVVIRTCELLYVRCFACAFLWKQPGVPQMSSDKPYTWPERRVNRIAIPQCKNCGSTNTSVNDRTDRWLYVRCADCAYEWSIRNPGGEPT